MLYLDSSLVVTALIAEPDTEKVRQWFNRQAPNDLAISEWVVTECTSALSVRARSGTLTHAEHALAIQLLKEMIERSFLTLEFDARYFQHATTFAQNYAAGLRSGDALHLAIVAAHGAMLCTRDKRFHEAALIFDVDSALI